MPWKRWQHHRLGYKKDPAAVPQLWVHLPVGTDIRIVCPAVLRWGCHGCSHMYPLFPSLFRNRTVPHSLVSICLLSNHSMNSRQSPDSESPWSISRYEHHNAGSNLRTCQSKPLQSWKRLVSGKAWSHRRDLERTQLAKRNGRRTCSCQGNGDQSPRQETK